MTPRLVLTILLLATALPALAPAPQKKKRKEPKPQVTRVCEVDAKGLQQWTPWDKNPPPQCVTCKGAKVLECLNCKERKHATACKECGFKKERKAACHTCIGKGVMFDPLVSAPCPGCAGHGMFPCCFCYNDGRMFWVGGGKKGVTCIVCKSESGLSCRTCNGKRTVRSAFKGAVGKAKLKQLRRGKGTLTKVLAAAEKFKMKADLRKSRKAWTAMLKPAQRDFPDLKKANAMMDRILKALDQAHIGEIETHQQAAFDRLGENLRYYLRHELAVIDLCIARAEFNEAAAAKK